MSRVEEVLERTRSLGNRLQRTAGARNELAVAVGTDVVERLGAISAKRAFERADSCVCGVRRQFFVAALAIGT